MAFIPNIDNKDTVNHINGDKLDNHVSNLEWATWKEQKTHAIRTGLCKNNQIALSNANKNKTKAVYYNGKVYKSINEARKDNHVHWRNVIKEGVML